MDEQTNKSAGDEAKAPKTKKAPRTGQKQSTTIERKIGCRVGTSLRSYRRVVDTMIKEVFEGRRPSSELKAVTAAAKVGSEILMTERIVARSGGDVEDEHPLGPDGGFEPGDDGKPFVSKKVTVKQGKDRFGADISQVQVVTEGSSSDPSVEGGTF